MSNIVGTPVPQYVANQITNRQRILGKPFKDPKDLVWANGKTSYIRLASSVNIESQDLIVPDGSGSVKTINDNGSTYRQSLLGLNGYGGSKLAKELVLQGGAILVEGSNNNNNLSTTLRSGVTQTNSTLPSNKAAYGYGGTEFGIQPMPGITSFSIKDYNNGTLREANLEILVHNRIQFEYIDTLYLRLGYTMFIEWGNTTYPISVNNSGDTTYATPAEVSSLSLVGEFLNQVSETNSTPDLQTLIELNREQSYCNYDGFVGQVINFSWDFTEDGRYKISLRMLSAGGVIESLKLNNQLEGTQYPIISNSGSDSSNSIRNTALYTFTSLATQVQSTLVNDLPSYPATKTLLTTEEQEALQLSSGSLYSIDTPPVLSCNIAYGAGDTNIIGIDKGGSTRCYYVHFGSLLEYINQKLLSYDSEGNPNFISIDTNLDTFVYSNGWSFSSDPTKFIVALKQSFTNSSGGVNINFFDGTGQPEINKFHDTFNGIRVGRLMNVYLERDYIKKLIELNQDPQDGSLYLNKFLEAILSDINVGLGNVNKIKYRATDVSVGNILYQKIQFYDEVSIYGKEKITGESNYQLNLFGFDTTTPTEIVNTNTSPDGVESFEMTIRPSYRAGSFVTNYGIKTEITNRLMTQISIGAQAGGQAVGYDSTAISKWNVGLIDRINPKKIDANLVKTQSQNNYASFVQLAGQYLSFLKQLEGTQLNLEFDTTSAGQDLEFNVFNARLLFNAGSPGQAAKALFQDFGEGVGYVAPNLNLLSSDGENQFAPFQNVQTSFFNKALAASALSQNAAGTPFVGFLPINLTVTLDGISGIKIFNKLVVDSRFLPPNYGETLEFVITGIDHSFEGNKWTTTLQTLSIPKLFAEAQVIFGEAQLENILEDVPAPPNDDDSYFVFNNVYDPDSPFASTGRNTTQAGQQASINDILRILNQSPVVQSKFRTFLESILTTYPKGYKFSINDIARPVDSTTGVGISSAHVYSVAIDLSVKDAKTGKKILGLQQTEEGVAAWRKFGIPALAEQAGLEWGGTYTSGTWKFDTVHFTALLGWAKYSPSVKKNLFNDLPRLKTLLGKTSKTQEDLAALKSVDLRNYLLVESSNVTTSSSRIRFRQWFKNNEISDYQQ
jgi:hypothetical protein